MRAYNFVRGGRNFVIFCPTPKNLPRQCRLDFVTNFIYSRDICV